MRFGSWHTMVWEGAQLQIPQSSTIEYLGFNFKFFACSMRICHLHLQDPRSSRGPPMWVAAISSSANRVTTFDKHSERYIRWAPNGFGVALEKINELHFSNSDLNLFPKETISFPRHPDRTKFLWWRIWQKEQPWSHPQVGGQSHNLYTLAETLKSLGCYFRDNFTIGQHGTALFTEFNVATRVYSPLIYLPSRKTQWFCKALAVGGLKHFKNYSILTPFIGWNSRRQYFEKQYHLQL